MSDFLFVIIHHCMLLIIVYLNLSAQILTCHEGETCQCLSEYKGKLQSVGHYVVQWSSPRVLSTTKVNKESMRRKYIRLSINHQPKITLFAEREKKVMSMMPQYTSFALILSTSINF